MISTDARTNCSVGLSENEQMMSNSRLTRYQLVFRV